MACGRSSSTTARTALRRPLPRSPPTRLTFYQAALEVFTVGNGLTPEQKAIATFWADASATERPRRPGTGSGSFQVAAEQEMSLSRVAQAYARLRGSPSPTRSSSAGT